MNKIKIIECFEIEIDGGIIYDHVVDSTTWTEVDDATLQDIQTTIREKNNAYPRRTNKYIVIKEMPEKSPDGKLSIEGFVKEAAKIKQKRERDKQVAEEAAQKRQKTVEKKRAAKEKALLEELKKKYE